LDAELEKDPTTTRVELLKKYFKKYCRTCLDVPNDRTGVAKENIVINPKHTGFDKFLYVLKVVKNRDHSKRNLETWMKNFDCTLDNINTLNEVRKELAQKKYEQACAINDGRATYTFDSIYFDSIYELVADPKVVELKRVLDNEQERPITLQKIETESPQLLGFIRKNETQMMK